MAEQETAEVLTQDGPTANQDNAEVSTDVTAQAGEVDPQATANEGDDENQEHGGKRLGGWQRKIVRLEKQLETALNALDAVAGKKAEPVKPEAKTDEGDKAPVKPIRPRQSDFDGTPGKTWEDWEKAQAKYDDDNSEYAIAKAKYDIRVEQRQEREQSQQKSERQVVADAFSTQVEEMRKQHTDYDAVAFSKSTAMTDHMMEAIVTSDLGAAIAYELGSDPDEAARIAQLRPVAQVREIGKIEARIAQQHSTAEKEEKEEPAVTRAAKPAVPVRKTTGVNTEPDDKDDYPTWLRKREAQVKRN